MDEPQQPSDRPDGPAGLRRPPRSRAGSGASILRPTRDDASGGSLLDDTRQLVDTAVAGARLGSKVGAAPGAAVGAVAGTTLTAVRNQRTRRRLVIVLLAPTIAGVLAWTMVIVALGSMAADRDQARAGASEAAAVTDGLADDEIAGYRAAADSTGVSWMLLAAVDRSAGYWTGPGDPPYGITDPRAFNAALAGYGLDPLTPAQFQDRVAAGYAFGRLFAAKLNAADPELDPARLDAGAGVMSDPADTARQVLGVDPDDSHALATHETVRSAFEAVLTAMPTTTSTDAEAVFDAAFRWSVGQARDCGGDPFAAAAGDPGMPRSTGSGARIDVTVATWNAFHRNPTVRVVAGIEAIGASADVIGLQELLSSSKRRSVAHGLGDEWAMYAGGSGNNTNPIVWRRSTFDLLAYGAVPVSDLASVEAGPAGTVLGPRWATWVQLRQKRTGGSFVVVNTHLVSTIDRGGRPDPRSPARLRVYDQQMDRLLALVDRLKAAAPVIGTMDANIDARGDARYRNARWPYVRMAEHGVHTSWRVLGSPAAGTYRTRLTDYVWSTSASVGPVAQQIGGIHGSDHKPVLVTLSTLAASGGTAGLSTVSAGSASLGSAPLKGRLTVPGAQPGTTITLAGEQVANAAIVIAEGRRSGVPMLGWVVALATALQESGIRNLRYGDRDSQGLFQQRPSAGWGRVAQIRDPHLAARAFYGVADHTANPGLTDIAAWQGMSVAAAAQAVQRSAFPDAYAKWEPAARAIVGRLTGLSSPAVAAGDSGCAADGTGAGGLGPCPATGLPVESGLTPDALLVLRCARQRFGQLATFHGIGNRPANTDDDHQTGRAVDLMIPDHANPASSSLGWEIAAWLRAHHAELGVHYVIFAAKIWNVDRDAEGWRSYRSITGSDNATSLHYDHVHVSVFGDRAAPADGDLNLPAGSWTMPLPKGGYRVGCRFGCYAGHTGQDFPVPSGTALRSGADGIVIRSEAIRDGSGAYRSYGNLIVVAVDGELSTTLWYAHLSRRDVTVGQRVRAGQRIGATGYTGNVIPAGPGGAHLHFEVRVAGTPINPLTVLRGHGVTP